MSLPKTVKIVEVGPRDGLQNEPNPVSTEIKLALIHRLAEAGLPVVEATSFVSPQWVPQMADHQAVMAGLQRRPGTRYPVLVPNARGMENALAAGVDEIAIFIAASEAFSQKNLNCSIEKSFERYQQVMAIANVAKLPVRAYISCVIDCPYAGATPPEQVAALAERLIQLGCYEISLGETIGTGTPKRAQRLIEVVSQSVPLPQLAVHFHNTYGQALANIYAVLEHGISIVDSAVAGLGGCPYAPGAGGNVATEDVLYLLAGLGIKTDVDLEQIIAAGNFICEQLGRPNQAHVSRARQACNS